jgi:hypothetical protein
MWNKWEMVCLPHQAAVREDDGGIEISSAENGKVFITHRSYFPSGRQAVLHIDYANDFSCELNLELILYFYKETIVCRRFSRRYAVLQPGSHVFYPRDENRADDYDSYRISLRIKELQGNVRIAVGV